MTAACNCDDAKALAAELRRVQAERDYMAGMMDAAELAEMRRHLREEFDDGE